MKKDPLAKPLPKGDVAHMTAGDSFFDDAIFDDTVPDHGDYVNADAAAQAAAYAND